MRLTDIRLAAALSAVSIIGISQAMAATPISGQWKVHTNMVQESNQVCTFTQNGDKLSGTCVGDNGDKVTIAGAVHGRNVSWSYKTQYNGMPLTVAYAGLRKSPTKIAGSSSVTQFGVQGDFTAVEDMGRKK